MGFATGTIPVSRVAVLLKQASRYLEYGKTADADILLSRLLRSHPGNHNTLSLLGVLRYKQKRFEEAAALFARSLEVYPKQPSVRLNLGLVLREQGMEAEAIVALRAAIKLKPDLVEAYFVLGNLLHKTGKLDEAEHSFRKQLQLSPGHVPAKLSLSAVLIHTKRPSESVTVLRSAMTETSDLRLIASLEENLGIAFTKQYQLEEAANCYKRARAANPNLTYLDHRCAINRGSKVYH